MTATSPQAARDFRARNRQYGELVPPEQVEIALLGGWSLIADACFDPSIEGALLAPPSGGSPRGSGASHETREVA